MSELLPPDHEFVPLLNAACDGILDDSQFPSLETALNSDPSFRRLFVSHVQLLADMELLGRAEKACNSSLARVQALLPQGSAPAPSFPAIDLHATSRVGVGYFFSGWPVAYLVATVIFAIGLAVAAIIHVSGPTQIATPSPRLPSPFAPRISVVAHITGMVDCVWEETGVRVQGSGAANQKSEITNHKSLRLGERLALRSGLLELTYETGARVILQGPVTYEVESPAGGYLSIGKLTAKLEKRSEVRGQRSEAANQKSEIRNQKSSSDLCPLTSDLFAIRTPTALVTDLGTEFGVDVDARGLTHAQVFAGMVRVETSGGQDDSSRPPRTLTAGQCAQVGKNQAISLSVGYEEFEKNAKRFTRTMPASPSDSDAYAKLVLSMNPVVYFRMDEWRKDEKEGGYVLVDSAPGGHHGVAHFDETFGKPSSRGKFGGALALHGTAENEYAVVNDYPKTENSQLSVSIWVWPVTLEVWAAIVGNRLLHFTSQSEPDKRLGQFGIGVLSNLELAASISQPDGIVVNVSEHGKPLLRSQWHHIALVADGTVVHLYHNGNEVAAAPYRGIVRQPAYKHLNVGFRPTERDAASPRSKDAYWNGLIDEIAIFNHAISPEQVHQLYTGRNNRK